jgi:tetratricopeptide (TPR) repeat protein
MTFLELEKICKKRRMFKVLKIAFFIILSVSAGIYAFLYFKKPSSAKKTLKPAVTLTTVNKPDKKIKEPVKPAIKKTSSQKLKLILDLNISEKNVTKPQKTVKIQKKSVKSEPVKNIASVDENKTFVITSQTLPSYETCMGLAKKYYDDGNYEEALKWAKNANIQDNKKAESWILSAKALYKLGKKKEALKILRIYEEYRKDERIEKLMGEFNETD